MKLMARLTLIAGAAALFNGCGGTQGVAPRTVTIQAPSQSGGFLVYNSIYAAPVVVMYSYPGGKYVGMLSGLKNTAGLCSDSSGDVWVIEMEPDNRGKLLEYAHGGSTPIASLRLDERADACAVDPSTGNLAAATLDSEVAVWTKAQGSPMLFSTKPYFKKVQTISYDGSGNLYMRSFADGKPPAAWLPKGSAAVMKFSITQFGSYAWDGQYFVIGPADGGGPLTRYKLSNGDGKAVGKVPAKLCAPGYAPPKFSILGSKLAVACGVNETNSLNYYKYPKGGKPIKTFPAEGNGGVAISE